LRLLVKPNGAKLWRLAYRYGGKQKTLAIGIYPAVTVAEARSGRDAARKLLTTGIDPSVKRTPTAWFIGEVCAQKGILIQSRRS
jgi:hypothetical protein